MTEVGELALAGGEGIGTGENCLPNKHVEKALI